MTVCLGLMGRVMGRVRRRVMRRNQKMIMRQELHKQVCVPKDVCTCAFVTTSYVLSG